MNVFAVREKGKEREREKDEKAGRRKQRKNEKKKKKRLRGGSFDVGVDRDQSVEKVPSRFKSTTG
jgi:hypothetical protein